MSCGGEAGLAIIRVEIHQLLRGVIYGLWLLGYGGGGKQLQGFHILLSQPDHELPIHFQLSIHLTHSRAHMHAHTVL